MNLQKLTSRIFYLPHEVENDRPMLAYIRGSRFSLAIDAGYSAAHVDDFYRFLTAAGLPLPDFTVLTHWHYDHTFGMHRIHGASIALAETNDFLRQQQIAAQNPAYIDRLKSEDPCFAREYHGKTALHIVLPDIQFQQELSLQLGGLTAQLFHTESPHSEDSVCVYLPEEQVLFLGDATSEDFFQGGFLDKSKLQRLVQRIEQTDCRTCILSHTEPLSKRELLDYLYGVLES